MYENSGLSTSDPLNYILKSRKCPPQHKDLMQIENDLLELIKSVNFTNVKNKFLDQLQKHITSIKTSKNSETKLGIFMKQIKTSTVSS